MAEARRPPSSGNPWRSAFSVAVGVIMAVAVVAGVFAAPRSTSSLQPPWPSAYPFGLGSNGKIAPDSIGFGEGTGTNNSCLFLFSRV